MELGLYFLVAGVLVGVGILGTVLPVLPGVTLVFAGLFVAAWAEHFTRVGVVGLIVIGLLGVVAFLADFAASILGAKRVGASPMALVGAAIGGVVGLFFALPGLLLGPFLGAVAGELLALKGLKQAGKVGVGTWIGIFFAAIAKLLIALAMVATFFAFYFFSAK
jgi:uncharacterized protein YqgC (DUF456 family)